jgi:hypothetical protein
MVLGVFELDMGGKASAARLLPLRSDASRERRVA